MSSKVSFSQIKKNIGLSIIAQMISLVVSFVMNLILPKFISEYQYALWKFSLIQILKIRWIKGGYTRTEIKKMMDIIRRTSKLNAISREDTLKIWDLSY